MDTDHKECAEERQMLSLSRRNKESGQAPAARGSPGSPPSPLGSEDTPPRGPCSFALHSPGDGVFRLSPPSP